jgi:hypothetical protein
LVSGFSPGLSYVTSMEAAVAEALERGEDV